MEGHVSGGPVFLFGKNGQVGARLMDALTAAGYEVTGIDRDGCDFMTTNAKEIGMIIRSVEPVLIINAAAYTAVDLAESETAVSQRVNAELPEMIAAVAEEQNVPMLHFSTDYVFDGLSGAPYDELAATHPLGVYAKTKLAGEAAVLHRGGTVFRLQWVFDAKGKNFFLTMKKLLAEREELRVVADQLGSPSNARHIAEAVAQAAPKMIEKSLPVGVYHLSADGHTSWHGFACAIADTVGSTARVLPITTEEYPTPAPRPKDTRLNTAKLAAHGISMPHWRDGLAQAIRDIHANS